MSETITLEKGLCLPHWDIAALAQGRTVATLARVALDSGEHFGLYPHPDGFLDWKPEAYYGSSYSSFIQTEASTPPILDKIEYWAKCQSHILLDEEADLRVASTLTHFSFDCLQELKKASPYIILVVLRVYPLEQPILMSSQPPKVGKFSPLPESRKLTPSHPILDDASFEQCCELWHNLQPAPHPELEKLESVVYTLSKHNPAAKFLNRDIHSTLRWKVESLALPQKADETWIKDIAALGDRSMAEDKGKSNYQAGTDFEIAVRNSLEFLGFTIDYGHKGGAGGLDLFCSKPYALVGECKSGKKIPNDTAVQLLNLGTLRLEDKKAFSESVKLIIGPGSPTSQLEKAAKVHGMAIINPQTLENLVRLHQRYPGSVDLFKLKDYLVDGRADDEVDKYIDSANQKIRLRSTIVNQVKHYLDDAKTDAANLDALHAVYLVSKPPQKLTRQEFHEILLELSSPLTGYLGRKKSDDGSDRFYFLRDLNVN
ncbi:MAG: DUF1802 family protein [Leptolyngbyaceae cyanobacterium]